MGAAFTEPPRDFGTSDGGASRYVKQLAALEQRAQSEQRNTNGWRLSTFAASGIAAVLAG